MKEKILSVLSEIIHPESGMDIVSAQIVRDITVTDDSVGVRLGFPKSRDPFTKSIVRQVQSVLEDKFPQYAGRLNVTVEEKNPAAAATHQPSPVQKIGNIIAVASGKGGVGKSTVAANLAVTLASMGYRTGLLDADIYGPSQPKMFGIEDYTPIPASGDGMELIQPATAHGVKIMSVGFFIKADDALVWRGPMATSALKQLIHQTSWGELDYLVVDLPPGTGDVHLTAAGELGISGAVIVTTPQQVALADVQRGISMFRSEGIDIPVLGIVENMAWFTPVELPDNKYYIFGSGETDRMAEKTGLPVLARIPLIMSITESADNGKPAALLYDDVMSIYKLLAKKIVENRCY